MYIETWGGGGGSMSALEVLALCPERQGSFLRSRLARQPAVLKQRHSVNLVGLGRGLGTGEWGRFLLSPPQSVYLWGPSVSSCCFWTAILRDGKLGGVGGGDAISDLHAVPFLHLGQQLITVWCWPNQRRSVFPTTHHGAILAPCRPALYLCRWLL